MWLDICSLFLIRFHHIKQGKNTKLGERNKEQKKADADQLDWLKNAAKATEGNIMGHYEMFNVKGGTKTKCLVRGGFSIVCMEQTGPCTKATVLPLCNLPA